MDLNLDRAVGDGYSSLSQMARVITQDWAAKNLFCVACPSASVLSDPENTPVTDFSCPLCESTYQLKSKSGAFGNTVSNSAYVPKIAVIKSGTAPNYAFLQYSRSDWCVTDLFVIPGHFFSTSVVQARKPLGSTARRKGWVGSNILLGEIPVDGRIALVSAGAVRPVESVREDWRKFEFLKSDERASEGWGADILARIRILQSEKASIDFTLMEFYERFVEDLSLVHQENRHIEAKIRQQLQVLRDAKVIQFLGKGRYQIIG